MHHEFLKRTLVFRDQILQATAFIHEDPKGYELWQTPKRRCCVPAKSRYMFPFNLAAQECKICGTGEFGPQSGDIALDCSANMGVTDHEELLAGTAKVVAFEPAPENVERLRRAFAEEIALGRVIIIPKGVWDKDDFLMLRVDPINSAANTFILNVEGKVGAGKVPVTTIDKVVLDLGLERVDYIKFDVEGAELFALEGARETIT